MWRVFERVRCCAWPSSGGRHMEETLIKYLTIIFFKNLVTWHQKQAILASDCLATVDMYNMKQDVDIVMS